MTPAGTAQEIAATSRVRQAPSGRRQAAFRRRALARLGTVCPQTRLVEEGNHA
jgi:hypothetical protein